MKSLIAGTKLGCVVSLLFLLPLESVWAQDSYRYLHVTIDTPWSIFLFLLPIVLSPFILMAILYWRFAGRKRGAAPTATMTPAADSGSGEGAPQQRIGAS